MRAVIFHEHGPFENLTLVSDWPEPVAGPGEVIVAVAAVTLNGFDPMVMRGIPGLKTPLPMIPGADIAGRVVAHGPDVDAALWPLGARVAVQPNRPDGMMGETLRGGMCERLAVPQQFLIPIPDAVSDDDAACLPTAYATAYRMLHTRGRIKAGERVLILGASGGVGTCCIQLAKRAGCEVIAVTSSAAKADALRALGADHAIDGSTTDYVAWVAQQYGKPRTRGGPGGVEVCVNYTGGDTWAQCFRAVARDGRILTCGATAGYAPPTDLRYTWSFEHNILGSNGWTREDHVAVLDLIAERALVPAIDRVVDMESVAEAMRDLAERRVTGKVVIRIAAKGMSAKL